MQLDRVDVAGQPRPDRPGLVAIPVQLQGQGDIYGLVDFLYRVERGEKLLVVDDLTLNAGVAWMPSAGFAGDNRSQRLTWSVRLHGLYGAAARESGS